MLEIREYLFEGKHNQEILKKHIENREKIILIKSSKKTLGKEFEKGTPDYFYFGHDSIKIYYEIKYDQDSIRKSQMTWMLKNINKTIIIAWFIPKKLLLATFKRGADIILLKIIQRINIENRFKPWYINEFMDLGYSYHQIRKCLQELEKRGFIKKVKAYPVFWEKIK